MTTLSAVRSAENLTGKENPEIGYEIIIERLPALNSPKHRPFDQSFLQRPTSHQGAVHEHVAHDDLAASLHEALGGRRVECAAAGDEAEPLQARAAGQGLKERRVGVQVGLLQPSTQTHDL